MFDMMIEALVHDTCEMLAAWMSMTANWQRRALFWTSTLFPIAMLVLALICPSALLALQPLDSAQLSAISTQCNVLCNLQHTEHNRRR